MTSPIHVVGMVHLRALPGAPRYEGSLDAVVESALADARALEQGGVDAILVENFGDVPFHKDTVPAATVAAMTRALAAIRAHTACPLGVNVLRNDGLAALAIAAATNASFIRVNVYTGARLTDQGIVEGRAAEIVRERTRLAIEDVGIFADVAVKHSTPLADEPLERTIDDTLARGLADGIIVTGEATGAPCSRAYVERARAAAGHAPLWAGSGVSADTIGEIADLVDGVIVGTWIKRDGDVRAPVDLDRVRSLVGAVKSQRR